MSLRPGRRGLALIFSLILVAITGIVIASLLGVASNQARNMHRHDIRLREFAAADMALNKVYAELRFFLEYGVGDIEAAVNSITPPTVDDVAYTINDLRRDTAGGYPQYELATSGPFVGLTLYTDSYVVELSAKYDGPEATLLSSPGITLRQDIRVRYVPLYIYGIFYDSDLEFIPGPPATESGRVHCNSNIYLAGDSGPLSILNYLTAHGGIHRGIHPLDSHHGSGTMGTVNFFDGTNPVTTQLPDGSQLDHDHADWAAGSLDRWDGYVLDSAHGMPELPLPIPEVTDPHVLIEPASVDDPPSVAESKFHNKADVVIEYDSLLGQLVALDGEGNPIVPPPGDADGNALTYDHDSNPGTVEIPVAEFDTFHDNREGQDVTVIDVHMDRLVASGIDPPNGILYVNYTGGMRLTDGAELPTNLTGGFTVATPGPAYVEGDYNTVVNGNPVSDTNPSKLSLVACDAFNVLSNAWNDGNSWSTLGSRNASNTEMRTVIMAGNVPTDGDTPYSGGVENYFRFHEGWSGRTFQFRGSIINLWDSEVATANWSYGNPVYTAPNRDWDWDLIYGGLAGPPGMPRVFFIDRLEWQEVAPSS
jgi:hypothetical protein